MSLPQMAVAASCFMSPFLCWVTPSMGGAGVLSFEAGWSGVRVSSMAWLTNEFCGVITLFYIDKETPSTLPWQNPARNTGRRVQCELCWSMLFRMEMVGEAFVPRMALNAEIGFAHILVGQQVFSGIRHNNAAVFHHIAPVGGFKRQVGVLLH